MGADAWRTSGCSPAGEGYYQLGGELFHVKTGRGDRRYAERLVVEDEPYFLPSGGIGYRRRATWEYARGMVFRLTEAQRVTEPEAAGLFGSLSGQCIRCGRALTDETSVHRGVGPVCAAAHREELEVPSGLRRPHP